MKLESSAFAPDESIPAEHANTRHPGGRNVSIPYTWTQAPEGAESTALELVDLSPVAHAFVHWLVIDLPPGDGALTRGASRTSMPGRAIELRNSFGTVGYGGPTPPPGTGQHPYRATVYALDVARLSLPGDATLDAFHDAIEGHVLAQASYSGVLGR